MKGTRSISYLFLLLIFLAIPTVVFSQRKTIEGNDYRKAMSTGFQATRKIFPRRQTRTVERFDGDKLQEKFIETYDYITEDSFHITTEDRKSNEISRDEFIRIRNDYYCRKDAGNWTKNAAGCYEKPPPPRARAFEAHFAQEEVTIDGHKYTQYISSETYQGKLPSSTTPTTYVRDEKFILNPDSTLYRRTIETYIESSKSVTLRQTFNFKYNAKIKIKAPVK